MTSPLSNFITELRRRRVFRVAAVYAGITFVIIQIIDGTFAVMGIPDWISRLIIMLLLIGFPIAIGLAWAFDITDEGIVRTKGRPTHAKRKTQPLVGNTALGIIASLAILVAVWNWWQKEEDLLFAYEHSIVVMPFENLTNDLQFDVWGKGVASLIIDDLIVYEDLYVMDSQTIFDIINTIEQTRKTQVLPEMAKEVADRTGIRMLLLGDILKAGSTLLLQARLLDARTGQVIFSHQATGGSEDDLPTMAQSLAERVRNHLEIGIIEKGLGVDYRVPRVRSAKAYRLYVQGVEDSEMSRFPPAIEALQQAVALDTLLGMAYSFLIASYGEIAAWLTPPGPCSTGTIPAKGSLHGMSSCGGIIGGRYWRRMFRSQYVSRSNIWLGIPSAASDGGFWVLGTTVIISPKRRFLRWRSPWS